MKRSLLLLLFVLVVLPAAAQSIDELFQQALRLERVQGDYRGAIAVYEQIVDQAGSDRTARARALVDMGKAYESLGRSEAVSIYERVLREYADQADEVAEARARMAGLAAAEPTTSPTEFTYKLPFQTHGNAMPSGMYGAAPSHSGRWFAREGKESGIVIDDLDSGEMTHYSASDLGCGRIVFSMSFSPDDRQVAFGCFEEGYATVRVLDRQTGEANLVASAPAYLELPDSLHFEVEVYDWTQDGGILASLQGWARESGRHVVGVVYPDGRRGPVFDPQYWSDSRNFREKNACLMNGDTVMVAEYSIEVEDDDWEEVQIRSVQADGLNEQILLAEPSVDFELYGCDKDKDVVYYTRKAFGTRFLFAATLTPDGLLQGHRQLRALPEDADPAMSQNGEIYYYSKTKQVVALVEAPMDPATGKLAGPVRKVSEDVGGLLGYTPDGRELMARTWDNQYILIDTESGRMRDLGASGNYARLVSDLAIIVDAPRHQVPALTDSATVVSTATLERLATIPARATLSPDLSTLFFAEAGCIYSQGLPAVEVTELLCPDVMMVGDLFLDGSSGMIAAKVVVQNPVEEGPPVHMGVLVVNPESGKSWPTVTYARNIVVQWAGEQLFLWKQYTDELYRFDPKTGGVSELDVLRDLAEDVLKVGYGALAVSEDQSRVAMVSELQRSPTDIDLFRITDPIADR